MAPSLIAHYRLGYRCFTAGTILCNCSLLQPYRRYWSSQNHHAVSNLHVFTCAILSAWNILLPFPSSTWRNPTCPSNSVHGPPSSEKFPAWFRGLPLCIPNACPEHTSLQDLSGQHQNWWFPCLPSTVNTYRVAYGAAFTAAEVQNWLSERTQKI